MTTDGVTIGDTFEHSEEPGVAWEVTDAHAYYWELCSGDFLRLATTAQLIDPAGRWTRCEARAVMGSG